MSSFYHYKHAEISLSDRIRSVVEHSNETVTCEMVDIAIVHRVEAYCACRYTWADGRTYICAIVVKLAFIKEDRFSTRVEYDLFCETCGPTLSRCPERILNLLTVIPVNPGYSEEWRTRCRAAIEKRQRDLPHRLYLLNRLVRANGYSTRIIEHTPTARYRKLCSLVEHNIQMHVHSRFIENATRITGSAAVAELAPEMVIGMYDLQTYVTADCKHLVVYPNINSTAWESITRNKAIDAHFLILPITQINDVGMLRIEIRRKGLAALMEKSSVIPNCDMSPPQLDLFA